MEIDSIHFPSAAKYLRGLPQGLESYPQCVIKTDVLRGLTDEFSDLSRLEPVPPPIDALLAGRYPNPWFSEVAANALMLMIRDGRFESDEAFFSWYRHYIGQIFDKPAYRVMMHVFSTSLAVMGATRRWATFHRGSTLKAEAIKKDGGRYRVGGTLSYPPRLFDRCLLQLIASTYLAALDANRAEEPEVSLEETSPTAARFRASWKA